MAENESTGLASRMGTIEKVVLYGGIFYLVISLVHAVINLVLNVQQDKFIAFIPAIAGVIVWGFIYLFKKTKAVVIFGTIALYLVGIGWLSEAIGFALQITFEGLVSLINAITRSFVTILQNVGDIVAEFTQSLRVIAEYQPIVAMPVFGGLHLIIEIGIIVILTAISLALWVKIMNPRIPEDGDDDKKIVMTIKWVIFWIWAIYAAYRGIYSMLGLYLLAYALIQFGPKFFGILFGRVTVKVIDTLEKKGWKKLVSFITTATIAWAVLVTGIIGYWVVIVSTVFSQNPIPAMVFGCAGIAIAMLHKK